MKDLKPSNIYYREDVIIKHFSLDRIEVKYAIYNNPEPLLRNNSFRYKDSYYINIIGLYYIAYTYRPSNGNFDMFKNLIIYVDNNEELQRNMLKNAIDFSNYTNSSDIILIFGVRDKAGYVYLAEADDLVKIGITSNPMIRLEKLKYDAKDAIKSANYTINNLFHFNNMIDAGKLERELHSKYSSQRYKGEWFYNTNDIVSKITNDNADRLVI